MLSNKSLGIAGAAMLGTVALLGTNAANAAINVSTGMDAIKYAVETLDRTDIVVDDDGNRYYRLAGVPGGDTTNIVANLGVGGEIDDEYSVTYSLSGMVLGGQGVDFSGSFGAADFAGSVDPLNPLCTLFALTSDGNDEATRLVGGGPGSNSVSVFFTLALEAHKTCKMTLPVDSFAMTGAGTGSITVRVKNLTLAALDVATLSTTKTASMAGAVRVAAALKETTISDASGGTSAIGRPISRVEHDYTSFGDDPFFVDDPKMFADSVGSLSVAVGTDFLNAGNAAPVTIEDLVDADESMVTYGGDFSFASKVYLADDEDCGGGDVADDLLIRGADDAVTSTTSLMPQKLSVAGGASTSAPGGKHLCIMVDGDTVIPETGRYAVNVDYKVAEGGNTRVYPPKGKSRRLAYIEQNGIRITIPYLTTASQYNQRIVVANLSGAAVEYRMSFHPEAGTEAEAGANAMGTFEEGSTVLSVANDDVVTISGDRTRTAARLVIEADIRKAISVATTQVNRDTGSTDTVRYR